MTSIKKSVKEHPLDARHWLYLGQLYILGARYNSTYIDEAEDALQKSVELSPTRQQIYIELARVNLLRNDNKKAVELLEHAVELNPKARISVDSLSKVLDGLAEQETDLVDEIREWLKDIN